MELSTGAKPKGDSEWYFKYVEGVKCVCWKVDPQNEKERATRRKVKEKLGKVHKEILMIDTKQGSSQREICDIIFTTDKIDHWEDQFINWYKSKYTQGSSYINGGFQHAWKKDGTTVVTMNFYTSKNRIMVQPGQQEEKNILQFIRDFKEIQEQTKPDGGDDGGQAAGGIIVDNMDSSDTDDDVTSVKRRLNVGDSNVDDNSHAVTKTTDKEEENSLSAVTTDKDEDKSQSAVTDTMDKNEDFTVVKERLNDPSVGDQIQNLEERLVEVIENYKDDHFRMKLVLLADSLEQSKKEVQDYKKDSNIALKENEQLRREYGTLNAKFIRQEEQLETMKIEGMLVTTTKCESCEKIRNEMSSCRIEAEEFKEESKGIKEKFRTADSLVKDQDLEIKRINKIKTDQRNENEKLRVDISNLQDRLIQEKDNHLEWSLQIQKQLDNTHHEDWKTVQDQKKDNYKGALQRTKVGNEDLMAKKRSRNIYHLNDIVCVQGRDDPLSNFSKLETPLHVDGLEFSTLEHLYQYKYCLAHNRKDVAVAVASLLDPGEVKDYARKHIPKCDNSWRDKQEEVMMEVLQLKHKSSAQFRAKLRASRDKPLLHTVKDAVWGIGMHTAQVVEIGYIKNHQITGEDKFGLCLEALRELMKDKESTTPQPKHLSSASPAQGPPPAQGPGAFERAQSRNSMDKSHSSSMAQAPGTAEYMGLSGGQSRYPVDQDRQYTRSPRYNNGRASHGKGYGTYSSNNFKDANGYQRDYQGSSAKCEENWGESRQFDNMHSGYNKASGGTGGCHQRDYYDSGYKYNQYTDQSYYYD
jgi:ribA/ribD-fused uncharacterized protein